MSILKLNSEDISKSWYEELKWDMPGIDSTVIELLKTQILGLLYFLNCQTSVMKFDHQAEMVTNQENDQVFTDLRRYGPLWGSKRGDISLSILWNNGFSTLPSSDDSISSEWRRRYSGSQMILHQKCLTIDSTKFNIVCKWAIIKAILEAIVS